MTTVFIDFKEQTILADRQSTSTHYKPYEDLWDLAKKRQLVPHSFSIESKDKIYSVEGDDPCVLVGAGVSSEIERLKKFFNRHGYIDFPETEDVTMAVVRKKGKGLFVELYTGKSSKKWYRTKHYWDVERLQGNTQVVTFGSGGDYAYGAYKAGASPVEAMRTASECDIYTSSDIDIKKL